MKISEKELRLFHDSLDRASADSSFLDLFYDGFISSSSEIRDIFKDADMERLKRKLKSSLHMMTLLVDGAPGSEMYMGHLARVHGRYHIRPGMFGIWVDTLISAVASCDSEFSPDIEAVWRKVIGRGVDIMLQGSAANVFPDTSPAAVS
jgi:truncated hemoglobin YjbI